MATYSDYTTAYITQWGLMMACVYLLLCSCQGDKMRQLNKLTIFDWWIEHFIDDTMKVVK